MSRKMQKGQEKAAAKKKITVGKIIAFVIGVIAVIYLSFSVHVFYNFIRILLTDPDAAKRDVSTVTMMEPMDAEDRYDYV